MATLAKMVTKTLDVGVSNTTIDLSATIKSFDVLDTKFIFGITSNQGLAINLSGATVKYIVEYYVEGKTYAVEGNCLVVDINTISFNLPDQLRGYNGKALIGIYATLTDGTKIDIKNIVVNIEPSLMDKGTDFKARYYFESFDNVLASVKDAGNKAISQINTVLPTVQSKVAEIDRQIKSLPPIPDLYVAYANSADGTVDFTKTKPKENLLVLKNKIVGKYVTNRGNLVDSTNYTTSDYIKVDSSKTYQIYYENNISISGKSGQHWLGYTFYDNNKNYIDNSYATLYWDDVYSGITITNRTVTAPTNAAYIIISWVSTYDYKIKLEKSDVQTMYLPSPMDDYLNSYMKYIGYGIKNSTNSADYRWQVNSEWQRAQVVGINLIKNTSNQLRSANEIYWKVLCSERNTNNFNVADHLGKSITVRVWLEKPTADSKLQCFFKGMGSASGNIIKAGQSGYSQLTINVPNILPSEWNIVLGNANGTHCDYKELKIQYGDFASEWTPAPEDLVLNANPINSILTTLSAENPSTTLGGTWTQLGTESKFGQTIYYWKRTN